MGGPAALPAAGQPVAQADVGEGAPHHDLVVAAPGAVGVEVGRGNAVLHEVLPGGAFGGDGPGGGDVVGGHRVAQPGQHPGPVDVGGFGRFPAQAREEGRFPDVGGVRIPGEAVASGGSQLFPVGVALKDVVVSAAVLLGIQGAALQGLHLGQRGPQVL